MKKTVLMAILASSLFACNNSDELETTLPPGERIVTFSVKQSPTSRSITDEKGATEYAIIGSGKLYFLDAGYNSIYQRQLTDAEVATLANTSSTASSGNTVTITGVPSTAQYLYFMANIKTSVSQTFPAVEGTTSADARLRLDLLQGDGQKVPMSGLSNAFVVSGSNPLVFNTSVELTPVVSRVEVGQVTYQNVNAPGIAISTDFTGFKLAGVFINNINQYVLLDGAPYLNAPVNIVNQASWASSWATYFTNNVNFPYYSGGSPSSPSDWTANAFVNYCTPTTTALSFYPDLTNGATNVDPGVTPKKAWAYQVCPSTELPNGQTTPVADIPHIILKLTDVTYVGNPLGQPIQYVTITKYKDASNNPILQFKKGNVYRIENLTFNHTQATNKPYDSNITVTATVSVKSWVINTVNPVW